MDGFSQLHQLICQVFLAQTISSIGVPVSSCFPQPLSNLGAVFSVKFFLAEMTSQGGTIEYMNASVFLA